MEALQAFEAGILIFIQDSLRQDWLNPIMIFITHLGDNGIAWIVLGLVMLIFKRTRRGGLIMLLCLLGAWIVNDFILKELIARVRPYEAIRGLSILVEAESSFSFPSGHTNSSFACAWALTAVYGKRGAWAYLPAGLIALSRCYVGVHYPTDTIAGVLVGCLMAFLMYRLVIYTETRIKSKKES
jgi:undecaprenyl-diphosphatase